MSRRLALIVVLTAFFVGATAAVAQQSRSDREPSLGERLEAFRDDLLGDTVGRRRKPTSKKHRQSSKQNSNPHFAKPSGMASSGSHESRAPRETSESSENDSKPTSASSRSGSNFNSDNTATMPSSRRRSNLSTSDESAPSSTGNTGSTSSQTAESSTSSSDASSSSSKVSRSPRSGMSLQQRLSAAELYQPEKTKPAAAATTEKASPSTNSVDTGATAARVARNPDKADADTSSAAKEHDVVDSPSTESSVGLPSGRTAAQAAAADSAEINPYYGNPSGKSTEVSDTAPSSERPAGKTTSVESENTLFTGQSALLSVEASGPRKVLVGREATFAVRVRNAGEAAANNVVVTINIPNYTEVVGSQATAGTTRAPTGLEHSEPLEWRIPRLEAHGKQMLTLKIVPRKSVPLDLAAQWTCSPETSQTMVEVQEPKLMMALSGPEEVLYGQSKVYKLTISNPGNGDAENVIVSLLPIGRTSDTAASHKLGTLHAGDSKAIEVELTARQAGTITIKAQAFADGGLRTDVSEQVLVRRANLRADIEGPKVKYAGTNCVYRIHITNTGNAVAENLQVSALLPPECKLARSSSGGKVDAEHARVQWSAGSLQPGAERVLELQCTLSAAGENRMQVLLAAGDDLSGSASTSTRVEAIADLKLEVRDPQGPVPVGDDAIYEVVVRNRGTKSAEEVDLCVFFSEGLEATSVDGGAYDIGRGQVAFRTIHSIAAGSDTVYRVHARADRSGNHVVRAEVVCPSLATKLAAEEATHFYGEADDDVTSSSSTEPRAEVEPPTTASAR